MFLFLFLFPLAMAYPYGSYNGYYNRFGDYILPSRPEYYTTSQGSSFLPSYYTQGTFSSYSTPSVATVNHGFGDYYRGYGNGLPAYGASDGRMMSSYPPRYGGSSYPMLGNDYSSYPYERSSFPMRPYPFKKQ